MAFTELTMARPYFEAGMGLQLNPGQETKVLSAVFARLDDNRIGRLVRSIIAAFEGSPQSLGFYISTEASTGGNFLRIFINWLPALERQIGGLISSGQVISIAQAEIDQMIGYASGHRIFVNPRRAEYIWHNLLPFAHYRLALDLAVEMLQLEGEGRTFRNTGFLYFSSGLSVRMPPLCPVVRLNPVIVRVVALKRPY